VTGICEDDNNLLSSIIAGEFLDQLTDYQLLKKGCAHPSTSQHRTFNRDAVTHKYFVPRTCEFLSISTIHNNIEEFNHRRDLKFQ
jgi:hypothetical protein